MSDITAQAKLLGLYPLKIGKDTISATFNSHHYFNKLSEEDDHVIQEFCSQYGILIDTICIQGLYDGPFLAYINLNDANSSKLKNDRANYFTCSYLMMNSNLSPDEHIKVKYSKEFFNYYIPNMDKMIRSYHPLHMLDQCMSLMTSKCLRHCQVIEIKVIHTENNSKLGEHSLSWFNKFAPKIDKDALLCKLDKYNIKTIILPKRYSLTPRMDIKQGCLEAIHWSDTDPKDFNFLPVNINLIFN